MLERDLSHACFPQLMTEPMIERTMPTMATRKRRTIQANPPPFNSVSPSSTDAPAPNAINDVTIKAPWKPVPSLADRCTCRLDSRCCLYLRRQGVRRRSGCQLPRCLDRDIVDGVGRWSVCGRRGNGVERWGIRLYSSPLPRCHCGHGPFYHRLSHELWKAGVRQVSSSSMWQ